MASDRPTDSAAHGATRSVTPGAAHVLPDGATGGAPTTVRAAPGAPAVPGHPAAGRGRSTAGGGVLLGSTVAMGLMAGLFFAFDVAVMPGLAEGDDRTYVTAMQNINRVIENGLFGLAFVGALLATVVGAWLEHRAGRRPVAAWALAALVLYTVALGVTMGVNIPLNNELADAGDPARIQDFGAVRERFEDTWVTANIARTLLCTAALGVLGRALVLHGRLARGR